ncbi:hypothetical protein SASPL_133602 [Salvia splendens]|uniref:Plastid transcriptionally active 6 n=1 Tax=Salvia splendens TaxID=180675 RepID=A0A8X8X5X3_SALSN|nr:hypothetical protein SASPL_133602 [Salvia splendens]
MNAAAILLTPLFPVNSNTAPTLSIPKLDIIRSLAIARPISSRPDFRVRADDGDADGGDPDDYDMDDDEVEEVDNKKDFDVDYDTAAALAIAPAGNAGEEEIAMVHSKSFVSIQGWDSEKIVDYRINEDEFHKICLLDCDFFIRKPPDPDNDVYDFREMYVTPPDTDVYAIPKVLAPMPEKYIRCAQSDYGCYNVTEPPIDAPRDPMYKSEREVLKVTVPDGRDRDRKKDLLVVRDKGNTFKIISSEERDDPTTVIEKEDWNKTRDEMEKHLRKLRDFSVLVAVCLAKKIKYEEQKFGCGESEGRYLEEVPTKFTSVVVKF